MKYMKDFVEHFSDKPAFNVNEVKLFSENRQASEGYHKTLIQNLLKSGRIFKITRGAYTFYEEVQFVGFAYQPFYYGLEDALSLRDLWEQGTNPGCIDPSKSVDRSETIRGTQLLD